MEQSWKARPMVPGKDTLSVMAMHYGLTPKTIVEVVRESGADVIRVDGFRGNLTLVGTRERLDGTPRNRSRKVLGWSDGLAGATDPSTIKLTRAAIREISRWAVAQQAA